MFYSEAGTMRKRAAACTRPAMFSVRGERLFFKIHFHEEDGRSRPFSMLPDPGPAIRMAACLDKNP
jgi:hypothetical protein